MRSTTLLSAALLAAGLAVADSVEGQKVSLHGFATQGYASATDYPIYGISTDGTGDYRTAAFQARFMATTRDHFVVQFSHQRLGSSNFMEFEDDVALDWLFYQRRLFGASIRAGRVPMPRGLFNEVRDVGVLLPFFRASKAFYSEGVESIDGVALSRSFGLGDWTADASVFGGDFDLKVELTGSEGLSVTRSELTRTVGSQLVVNTPLPGLRVAGGYMRAEYEETGAPFDLWTASVDGTFDRVFARAEYEVAETTGFEYVAYYGQAGVRVWKGLWTNVQAEWNTNHVFVPQLGATLDVEAIQDYALGVNYRFGPKLVLKAEWHDFDGYQVGVPVDPFGPSVQNDYFILGVAAAF